MSFLTGRIFLQRVVDAYDYWWILCEYTYEYMHEYMYVNTGKSFLDGLKIDKTFFLKQKEQKSGEQCNYHYPHMINMSMEYKFNIV